MAVKLTSTRQSGTDAGIKVLVYGPSGAGKTVLCSTTEAPTLIISAEAGLLSLRKFDIPVSEVKSIQDVYETYAWLTSSAEARDIEWVCLDSISEIGEVCLSGEKKATKDPRQAYGALAEKMGDLVRAFRDLPGKNVYFSCKQERVKDEATGALLYGPSMPGNTLKNGIAYFFDEVFALRSEKDPEGKPYRVLQTARDFQYEAKDRSGTLDPFEAPSLGHIRAKILAK